MPASLPALLSKTVRAVIPAAGRGTRLRPLSDAVPKEMLPVGRLPVLAHIAAELIACGITQALFVISDSKALIPHFFGTSYRPEGAPHALICEYVTQQEQRGLGDAILQAEAWVGHEPFVVAFGDCLIESAPGEPPLLRLMRAHAQAGAAASALAELVAAEKVSRYGIFAPRVARSAESVDPFEASDIVEKPAADDAPSRFAVAARWVLQPAIFEALRGAGTDSRGELNLTDSVRALCRAGAPLWAVPLKAGEARRDIGNFETYYAAVVRAALADSEYGEAARSVAAQMTASRA